MKHLQVIAERLERIRASRTDELKYYVPQSWNYWGFDRYGLDDTRKGEIYVDPYDFMLDCLRRNILPGGIREGGEEGEVGAAELPKKGHLAAVCGQARGEDSEAALASAAGRSPDRGMSRSVFYSMLPRMFTAWNHGDSGERDRCRETDGGELQPGTLLKTICLLPWLKQLGVNVLCLLPIFETSERYKKGGIGSPYAIKNMHKLDGSLHDELLGSFTDELLVLEFKAFMEAAHALGMKVMLDFVFRTVARDNDLILQHPEWFYWMELDYAQNFNVPLVEQLPPLTELNDDNLHYLYSSSGLEEYLSKFTLSPKDQNPVLWDELTRQAVLEKRNILDLVEESYGVTTSPGFSDVMNDTQPLWTDIAYLKYYFGVDDRVSGYIREDQPPYILQDSVCLNLYRGPVCNEALWKEVVGVIPYFQREFGIDGARVDSGHALPPQLNTEIIAAARAINPDFIFWAEDFSTDHTKAAQASGFDVITGMLWSIHKEVERPDFNRQLMDHLLPAAIPVLAALETPDSPRLALIHRDRTRLELAVALICFLPSTVVFLNNGMEAAELQPMNLGLENTEEGRFVLDEQDPMYGRLAFFDPYRIHWLDERLVQMRAFLSDILSLRARFAGLLAGKDHFIPLAGEGLNGLQTCLIYYDSIAKEGLVLLANRDFGAGAVVDIRQWLPLPARDGRPVVEWLYSNGKCCSETEALRSAQLAPGEVVIGAFRHE